MCFSFCIDIFRSRKFKRKNIIPINRARASLKEECQENFNGELKQNKLKS